MLDADDRQTAALYAIRAAAVVIGILGCAVTLGLAVRVFQVVAGW